MQRIIAVLLVTAVASVGLATLNVAAHHYESCPPAGPSLADLGTVSADCAAAYDAEAFGCDGPVETYVATNPVARQGVGIGGNQYYVCVSAETPSENGLWKESNTADGLQTEPFAGFPADTDCSASPLACQPAATAPTP
jgi:hypothetical protein